MLKALELSAGKPGLFIVQMLNVIVFNCRNNLTCIQLLFVFCTKSRVAIKRNLLSHFVMHNNNGLLMPDGDQ